MQQVGNYLASSGKQIVLGNYTNDVTAFGTAGQVAAGMLGIDLPADIRDITYDLTNWEWSWSHAGQTAIDAIGVVPVIGAVKYTDEAAQLLKHSDEAADALKGAGKMFGPMNPGPLADDVARTFSGGTYTQKVLTEDTIFYRVHGGNAEKVGSYMSRTPQNGGMQSQIDLALRPEWKNSATQVTQVTVPKGTVIYEGSAASQSINGGAGSLLGGGNQIYIPKGVLNSSWFNK